MSSSRRHHPLESASSGDAKRSRTACVEEARKTDAFDTAPEAAALCVAELSKALGDARPGTVVEPSAGAGNFVRALRVLPYPVVAFDLHRENELVRGGVDFLTWTPPADAASPLWVVGNPPFGHGAATVFEFFSHAATFADVIAFIVPRDFRRRANRVDERFTLIHERVLDRGSFVITTTTEHEAIPYAIDTLWQVWRRRAPGETRVIRMETRGAPEFSARVHPMPNEEVAKHVECARAEDHTLAAERFFAAGGVLIARASATPGRVCTKASTVGAALARLKLLPSGVWYAHNWYVFRVPHADDRAAVVNALGAPVEGPCVQGYVTLAACYERIVRALPAS
jgi:hypothetical protein